MLSTVEMNIVVDDADESSSLGVRERVVDAMDGVEGAASHRRRHGGIEE